MRKGRALRPGDRVAVISPGAAVDEPSLRNGVLRLEGCGFDVALGAHVLARDGYLAGTDAQRLADLLWALTDPEIAGVFVSRAGYGCGRLLPRLDAKALRSCCKVVIGHSDLTFLLTYLYQQLDLVTFHGPMVAGLGSDAASSAISMVSGEREGWHHVAPDVIRPGTGDGKLIGGCLSILVSMLGTPYAAETAGHVLFLEDINEKPFRIERMLVQLEQAGALRSLAGVVFGEMPGCTAGPDEKVTVRDVVARVFEDAPYPVAFGLPSGHGAGTATLPLGVRARLAGDRLTLLEAPLAD